MPWFKLPEFVKKRACRYLLQHYLGHFFKEKLGIDQLTLDISNGTGTITNVQLDTQALNESLENVNAPLEILDGFVASLTVFIPWTNLFRENCRLEISGLNVTVAPRNGFQAMNSLSMTESLISSSLTLSLKVAKQCMQQESDSNSSFEGMEACAQTIESILNRIEVSVSDIRFQMKYFLPDKTTASIIQLNIKRIEYFDEAYYGDSEESLPPSQTEVCSGESPPSSHIYTPPIFSIKNLKLTGVTLEVGQGPNTRANTAPDPRGFGDSSANIVRSDMYRCSLEQGTPTGHRIDPPPCEVMYPIASVNGPVEIRLKLNLTDDLPEPMLKVECTMGSLHLLLSPDIVHMLTEMTTGLIEDLDQRRQSLIPPQAHGRPINQQDYVNIVPQVTGHLQRQKLSDQLFSLNAIHSPETDLHSISRSPDEEDQTYFSIRSSLDDDLLPLDFPPAMSIARSDGISIPLRDPGNQLSSIASSGTPPNILLSRGSPLTPSSTIPISPHYTPSHVSPPREPFVSKPLTDCNKFVFKIGGISIALLHVSITSLYQLPDGQVNELNEYLPEGRKAEELSTHTQLALLYFHRLDKLTEQSGLNYITGTFLMDKLTKFAYAIPNDHLRLHVSGLNAEVQISALRTEACLSVNGANLSECLFDNPADLAPSGPFDALRVTEVQDPKYTINHTQVLKFHSSPEKSDPCISVRFLFSQEKRKIDNLSIPKSPLLSMSDLNISTLPFTLVLDVTILNRIHALLQPDMQASSYNQWSTSINYKSVFQSVHQSISTQRQVLFQNTVDESNILTESQTYLHFKSPSIAIICKIPNLEKRSCQDTGLWWKPSLRKESFLISSTNVRATFHDSSLQKLDKLVSILADNLTVSLRENSSSLPIKLILLDTRLGGPSNCPSVTIRLKEEPSSLLGDSVNIHAPFDPAATDTSNITDSVYVQSGPQTASPFSSKKYVHNQEELILPGNQREMEEFETDTKLNSLHGLEINLPVVKMHIPSKEILQILLTRLTELISWNSVPVQTCQTESLDPKKISPHLLSSSPLVPLHHLYIAQENGERHNYDSDEEESSFNSSPGTVKNSSATRQANSLSALSLSVNIDNIVITAITRVQEEVSESEPDNQQIDYGPTTLIQDTDDPVGECMLQASYMKFFHVTGYNGDDSLSYDSLFVKRAQLSHRGLLHEEPYSCVDTPNRPVSPDTLPVLIYCSEHLATLNPGLYNPKQSQYDKSPCISLAIRSKEDTSSQSKSITMSLLLTGLAMRHMFVPSYLHCFTQLGDLFSLGSNDIGTETMMKEESIRNRTKPSPVLFTLYTHLKECAIDYRPLHMPVKTFITISSFCFSSNIVSGAPTSMQRMLLEDVALYLSQKQYKGAPNLKEDYFCAMDFGLLELTLRLASEGISKIPQVDLSVSSNTLHIFTCADSIITLRDLLLYITTDGDYATSPVARTSSVSATKPFDTLLAPQTEKDPISSLTHSITGQLIDAIEDVVIDIDDEVVNSSQQEYAPSMKPRPRAKLHSDSNETLKVLHTEDGMEISFSKNKPKILTPAKPGLRPKSLTNPLSMSVSGDFSSQLSSLDEDDGFTLLSDPKLSQIIPEVRGLLESNEKIRVIENHFTIPDITTSDQLQPPSHYPCPIQRYSLKDLNIVWHLYGGSDFEYSRPKDKSANKNTFPIMSPSVRFSDTTNPLYKDDGLTQLSIVRRPTDTDSQKVKAAVNPSTHKNWKALGGPGRDPHNLMIIKLFKVKLQHEVYPPTAEQCSRFVLLVNDIEVIDKLKSSSINKFLHVFTSEAMPRPTHANMLTIKALMSRLDPEFPDNEEASIKISLLPMKLNIDQDALLMIKEFFTKILETKPISFPAPPFLPTSSIPPVSSLTPQSQSKPVYIRSFSFYPDLPIRVDYQAKHRLHMDQGTITGLLLSLTDLNCSEIKLKKLSSRKGFLGYDKLLEYVITEWLTDIKSYQLPRIIGGVGPMYYITQLAQGTVDLVRLPWQQYRQDGRIFWGLQQGATSFSSSTAMATLELANRVVVTIQSVAETIYELISPNYITYGDTHLLPGRPQDLREGITHAYDAVSYGVSNTAANIYHTAVDDKDFSYSRAVTGVIKQIPGSVIMPVIVATKATSSVLGGAKNQLMPDARRETEQKYKNVKNSE